VNIHHDKLYEEKRKTSANKSRVRTTEKKKCNYHMEAERKGGTKKIP
jgi:hypothetical protein